MLLLLLHTNSRLLRLYLHADEGQISRCADQGTQATSSQTTHGLLPQGQVLAVVQLLGIICDLLEDTQAGGCVGGLAQQTC